jgi:hypothetical protein
VAVRVADAVGLLSVALVVAESASTVVIVIFGVAGTWCVWFGELVIRNGGLYETATGISNQRLWRGYRCEKWQDIDRFQSAKTRVVVIRRDGSAWPLQGVAQGYRTVWNGGETRDVVAVLNERLGRWRSDKPIAAR